MSNPERVIYISGMGDEPSERTDIPKSWEQYGLKVEVEIIDWADTDYEERIKEIGDHIIWQSKICRTSVMGDSGGGLR